MTFAANLPAADSFLFFIIFRNVFRQFLPVVVAFFTQTNYN